MTDFPRPKPRFDVIDKFSRFIIKNSKCVEFRVFGGQHSIRSNWIESTQYARTIVGFYDRPDYLASDIRKLNGVSGYVTPNPIDTNFLHIKKNSFTTATRDGCCTDKDITEIKYFIIDIDPIRNPSKISATDRERALAITRRDAILGDYPILLPSCLFGSSGNGAWILVQITQPNTPETKLLVSQCLGSLAARFTDSTVEIDTDTRNPNRHLSIPGTVKCKGEHSEERPWRLVTVDGGELPGWQ